MALLLPPSFMQARTDHTAQQDRLNTSGEVSALGGLGYLTVPLVRQQATAALSVLVGRERFYIPGTENVHQGMYHCYNDADVTVALGATVGHASLVRIDMLVAEVRDSFYSTAFNDWQFRIVSGTAGSGVKPTLPNNAVEVATITMPATSTTILTSYIANTGRVATARGGLYPMFSTDTPIANPYDGMQIWYRDLDQIWAYTGSTFIFVGGKTTRTWENIRSTSNISQDSYSSGSFASLLTIVLPSNALAGKYKICSQLSLAGSVVAAGNIRVIAGATNLSYDARFDVQTALVTQPWFGSFLHSGGALTISVAHLVSSGSVTVLNASTKLVVDYIGQE